MKNNRWSDEINKRGWELRKKKKGKIKIKATNRLIGRTKIWCPTRRSLKSLSPMPDQLASRYRQMVCVCPCVCLFSTLPLSLSSFSERPLPSAHSFLPLPLFFSLSPSLVIFFRSGDPSLPLLSVRLEVQQLLRLVLCSRDRWVLFASVSFSIKEFKVKWNLFHKRKLGFYMQCFPFIFLVTFVFLTCRKKFFWSFVNFNE